jgi:hypothetical protein
MPTARTISGDVDSYEIPYQYPPQDVTGFGEGSNNYLLSTGTLTYPWNINQVTGPVSGVYSLQITHNLGYNPNVTIKNSAGDILETGIDYNSINQITLTMAQPFSGTAYLS